MSCFLSICLFTSTYEFLSLLSFQNTGVILENQIPDGLFDLGDCVFVYPSTFRGNIYVHIRRYKKYGNKFYPTQEGVTLHTEWIQYIMQRSGVPRTSKDLQGSIFLPEDLFKMESSDFQNFTFTRFKTSEKGECFTKSITITRDQWKRMIEQYCAISTAVADEVYDSIDFFSIYKNEHELPPDTTLPISLDTSLGQCHLSDILQNSFHKFMTSNGCLQEPETRAEELFGNREETFNNTALGLDMQDLVDRFYEDLMTGRTFLSMSPHSYLTQDFFKNVCLKTVLQKARKYLCPEDASEFFEDFL